MEFIELAFVARMLQKNDERNTNSDGDQIDIVEWRLILATVS